MKLLPTLLLLFLMIGCDIERKNKACSGDNPLEEVPWLKEKLEQMKISSMPTQIIRYKYQGNYVFWIDPCHGCSDGLISVYDCEGQVICEFGGIAGINTCPDFDANKTDSTLLFDNTISSKCGSDTPFEDLPWLGEIKQNLEMSMKMQGYQIIRYKYKGEYVFWVDPCYSCPDNLIYVYDCYGRGICEFGGIDGRNTCTDFETGATDSTMLINGVQE